MISYYMDLKGSSYVIDTVCSSSPSALEVGYHYIISDKCEDVIIGSAHLYFNPTTNRQFFQLSIFIKTN